jgi:hypothetical protein
MNLGIKGEMGNGRRRGVWVGGGVAEHTDTADAAEAQEALHAVDVLGAGAAPLDRVGGCGPKQTPDAHFGLEWNTKCAFWT